MKISCLGKLSRLNDKNFRGLFAPLHSLLRWTGKLFRNPLTFVLLVWGLMFLMLGVTLAYARGAETAARPDKAKRPGVNSKTTGKKIESVEIFSAGEDLAIPPRKAAGKAGAKILAESSRRRGGRE
jgi:hypothetical protein